MSERKNIKLTIEYDGSNYHGWQRQPNGLTIQEVIENAIKKITGEKLSLIASGRTDAGVHAKAQIANFHTKKINISHQSFKMALNSILPKDITIVDSCVTADDFHSRFKAKYKNYRYVILNRSFKSSFTYKYSWLVPYKLDMDAMVKGAGYIKGENDFSSFRASSCTAKNPVRKIFDLSLYKKDDTIIFDIQGNGFLKQMVRNIVGTLVEAGRGKISPEEIKRILFAKDRRTAGPTAPAKGLFLLSVSY